MRSLFTLCVLLSFGTLARGLPDAPAPKERPHTVDKRFILTMAVLGASATADAITTRRNLDHGASESNPIFGRYPPPVKQAGVNVAYFAGEVGEAYLLKRFGERKRWLRWVWMIEPTWQTQDHIQKAIHNARENWR